MSETEYYQLVACIAIAVAAIIFGGFLWSSKESNEESNK